jgi:hypothetical protein
LLTLLLLACRCLVQLLLLLLLATLGCGYTTGGSMGKVRPLLMLAALYTSFLIAAKSNAPLLLLLDLAALATEHCSNAALPLRDRETPPGSSCLRAGGCASAKHGGAGMYSSGTGFVGLVIRQTGVAAAVVGGGVRVSAFRPIHQRVLLFTAAAAALPACSAAAASKPAAACSHGRELLRLLLQLLTVLLALLASLIRLLIGTSCCCWFCCCSCWMTVQSVAGLAAAAVGAAVGAAAGAAAGAAVVCLAAW